MHFDLVDLRLFVNVVDAANITRGAERSHLSLASASARIKGMEEALGVALLERGRTGVTPTPAGRALVAHARLILGQVKRLEAEIIEHALGVRGRIRLLSNTVAASEVLPYALGAFLKDHPHIDIELEEQRSEKIVHELTEGTAELGIVADTVALGALEKRPLWLDRLVVVAAPQHATLATREEVTFSDLFDEPFVGLSAGTPLQEHICRHAEREGRQLLFRVRVNTIEGLCRIVSQNVGIGIVPKSAASRFERIVPIRAIPIADAWASRNLTLCARRFDALSPAAKTFARYLSIQSQGTTDAGDAAP